MTTQDKLSCKHCGKTIFPGTVGYWYHTDGYYTLIPHKAEPVDNSPVLDKSPVLNEWLTQDDVNRLLGEFYKDYPRRDPAIIDYDLFPAWMYKRGRLDQLGAEG